MITEFALAHRSAFAGIRATMPLIGTAVDEKASGIGAPRNAPAEILDKLNRQINVALADPKIKVRLADLGATVLPGSPGDFGKLIAEDTEKWAKVVRAANIKAQ